MADVTLYVIYWKGDSPGHRVTRPEADSMLIVRCDVDGIDPYQFDIGQPAGEISLAFDGGCTLALDLTDEAQALLSARLAIPGRRSVYGLFTVPVSHLEIREDR